MKVKKYVPVTIRKEEQDICTSYVPYIKTLHRSERHTYVTAYGLSDQWVISLSQAHITPNKNTENCLCSAVLQFDRR